MKKKEQIHNPLQKELKSINTILNKFLKQHFTIEIQSLQEYLHNVKDLLIDLTTIRIAPILTNIFSKFSNILQPFTTYSYDLSLDSLKQEVSMLRQTNFKLNKKVGTTKMMLEEYRVKSNRMTQFLYGLRVNNIDVDQLYKKIESKNSKLGATGLMHQMEEPEPPFPRKGVELQREEWLANLQPQSNPTSQYVSVKPKP